MINKPILPARACFCLLSGTKHIRNTATPVVELPVQPFTLDQYATLS